MLLTGARLVDERHADVRLEGDRVAAVADAGTLSALAGEELVSLDGYLVLGALAEPHAHLDKAYTADLVHNPGGDLAGAVPAWRAFRETLTTEGVAERARRAALAALARGTTAIRSHVDVGPGLEMRALEALVGVREELRELVDLQLVVMSYPLVGEGSEDARLRLRRALELGGDLIGGVPHGESDPVAAVEFCVELAAELDRPLDLHMDEHLRDSVVLPELARRVGERRLRGVTASHCVSLGMQAPEVQADVAAQAAGAGVGVVCCPATNLYLQGRDRTTAIPRGLTALRALRDAGVVLAAGGDNIQDPYNPLGCGDSLDTAQLLVLAGHLSPYEAYELVSIGARTVMGLERAVVEPGARADLVAIAAGSLREAIATRTEDRIVVRAGRIVARTRVQRVRALWRGE